MPDTLPILTAARRSLWDAIENWPALKVNPADSGASVFKQKFRFDDTFDVFSKFEPGIGEIPAISITPMQVLPGWIANQMMLWPTAYQITIWTTDWNVSIPERIVQDVFNALFQSAPAGSTVPYVKAATGYYPLPIGPIQFIPTKIGAKGPTQFLAITTKFNVTLRANKNPFGQ
ncbi:MAG: hypothetical protein NT069_22130 [Planctomycetota bacterium]|nr:hypothetical protein [Planctomycetota bacterium]